MSIRETLGLTGGTLYLVALVAGSILLFGFLAFNPIQGTLTDGGHRGITLKNCPVDNNFDINDRCDLDSNNPDFDNMGSFGDVNVHKDGNTNFQMEVDYLRHIGEDFAPQLPYLANNGYLTESGQEDVQEEGSIEDVRMRNDIVWNSDVRKALEAGTSCSVRIQPYSISEVVYTWNDSGELRTQRYHEDWHAGNSEYRDFRHFFPNKVTLQAEDVTIRKHSLWCQFDFKEMMDKGAEHSNMVEFEAGRLEAGGDDSNEGYAKINVDFGMDTDLDGEIDGEDYCPETPGLPEKKGCPNQASKILSLDGPRNTTVGEEARYSVKVRNPDDDSTTVSWSNGGTGESTSYSWNSTGNYTVSVTADDGITETEESLRVEVREKPVLESVFEFFGKIWSILTFSG